MPLSDDFILSSSESRKALHPGSFAHHLFANFDAFPSDRTALLDAVSERRLSFADLKSLSGKVASGLARRGFGKGKTISLFVSNCLENAPITFGANLTGGLVHLMKPKATLEELRFHLNNVAPQFIVTTIDCAKKVLDAVPEASTHVQEIYIIGGSVEGCVRAEELLQDSGDADPSDTVEIDSENDVAFMYHTGGTTGMSKAVKISHAALKEAILEAPSDEFIEDQQQMSLGYVPFTHIYSGFYFYGSLMRIGCGVVIIDSYDPETLLKTVEKYKITALGLTPVMMSALASSPYLATTDLSSVRRIVYGGAAMSETEERRLTSIFSKKMPKAIMQQNYGMTEVAGLATSTPHPSDPKFKKKFGSVGILHPSFELCVVSCDAQQRLCKVGERGQILLRSPRIMKGYWKKEEATRKAVLDGWYHSGDFGFFDEDDYVYALDRVDDLIHHTEGIIMPTAVEGVMSLHPAIQQCAVIGRETEGSPGQVPMLFVMPNEGCSITKEDVRRFAEERLAPHEWPQGGIRFVTSIPKSPAGKMLRRSLLT